MHTRQRDETENNRDICRIVETLATLRAIVRKTAHPKSKTFCHLEDDDYCMASTVGAQIIAAHGVSLSHQGLMLQGCLFVRSLCRLPAGITTAGQNRSPAQPPHARALCHRFVLADLRTPPTADETALVKRDFASQEYSRETACLGENSRLVCDPVRRVDGAFEPRGSLINSLY
jgi:hypothetical protein